MKKKINDTNCAEQMSTIVTSLSHIFEQRLSEEKINTAVKINFLLKQAEENKWDTQYINALYDVKKTLGITNSIYDLYV